ncbi:oxygenase MpaB family protein [Nonomuraea sp. LP-02]|uniref:oxygenase MpaB family protein n=1 Tax=Nonomuraea sp. LP-02 TaxID=3097960 RepID=UPI002E2F56CC|nr:oxygenase MpaB family protein [Nonomuraea sp. LP-02]MED7929940.1 oxygenase MpaB family protein [Nonomuraea sp. LP-02]
MDVEPFGPGSMHWDTAGEYRNLLVAGSALVLQTMHPAVGAAVAEHSTYKSDPWGRLNRTLESVQTWVYGGAAGPAEGRRLRELHRTISGVDERGRPYHALNAEAWAWVHLTLFERFVALNRHFGTPLTGAEQRRLYVESRQLGRMLRVPERELPPDLDDYWRYFDRMVAERLEPHPTALDVLSAMRGTPAPPGLPAPLRRLWTPVGAGAGEFSHFVTVGTLPPAVRDKLGLRWTVRDERRLRRVGQAVAALTPRLPERLRYMPIAYRARRAVRAAA